MATKANVSKKHSKIDKANTVVTVSVGIATFLIIFSLAATYALLGQRSFQARVIKEKEATLEQIEANKAAADQLKASYQQFIDQQVNAIGGDKTGEGERDGDNAKLVLDALPSKYDFPALLSSGEKVLKDGEYRIVEITGSDEGVNQTEDARDLVEMPFVITTEGSFESSAKLLKDFERSIRPFSPVLLKFTATDEGLELEFQGKSYYLPETGLKIETKVVK